VQVAQRTLEDAFRKPFSAHDATGALLRVIAEDQRAFRLIATDSFKEFVSALRPEYGLPDRREMSELVRSTAKDMLAALPRTLSGAAGGFSIGTDGWSSRADERFITVTVHYMTEQWALASEMIGLQRVQGALLFLDCLHLLCAPCNCFLRGSAQGASTAKRSCGSYTPSLTERGSTRSRCTLPYMTTLRTCRAGAVCWTALKIFRVSLTPFSCVWSMRRRMPCVPLARGAYANQCAQPRSYVTLLNKVRTFVSTLGHSPLLCEGLAEKAKLARLWRTRPSIDVKTRWSSLHHMLHAVCELQDPIVMHVRELEDLRRKSDAQRAYIEHCPTSEEVRAMRDLVLGK
jgi:hypothetical protein